MKGRVMKNTRTLIEESKGSYAHYMELCRDEWNEYANENREEEEKDPFEGWRFYKINE